MNLINKMSISVKKNENLIPSFHVPNEWKTNSDFNLLLEYQHSNIELFEESLVKMGYEDSSNMISDYLHFLILDLLNSEGIEFIERNEINQSTVLKTSLKNWIPNFIIRSDVVKKRLKPVIVVISIAETSETYKNNNKKLQRFNKKLKKFRSTFDAEFIQKGSIMESNSLLSVLSRPTIYYLKEQFQEFCSVHDLWLQSIQLKNEMATLKKDAFENIDKKLENLIVLKNSVPNFDDREKFLLALEKKIEKKAEYLSFKDGI
jgi:hypothetical protein